MLFAGMASSLLSILASVTCVRARESLGGEIVELGRSGVRGFCDVYNGHHVTRTSVLF
jgi:hypothetical protein